MVTGCGRDDCPMATSGVSYCRVRMDIRPDVEGIKARLDSLPLSKWDYAFPTPEQELYAFCPERAKANKRPGYPVGEDSGYGDTQ